MAVVLIGTLDTKGEEIGFVRDGLGKKTTTLVVDAGALGTPKLQADIPREAVFEAAGTTLQAIQERNDRGEAVAAATAGVQRIVLDLHRQGKVDGVLGLGGSAGTTIATAAMRALPFGLPKLMVSTLASGQVRPFVGPRDIIMMHSVTDILGLNRISRTVLQNAAAAMLGMISQERPEADQDKPIVTATMFGVTTPCVEHCRRSLEGRGFETLVFHAVGTGGEAMESLIGDGLIAGVLDVTTTELADELVGGVLSAGPGRLTAAGKAGVPQVISVGALDMVNFGPRETVPTQFADRLFYIHNANVTLMRTTVEENRRLGAEIARKLNQATGPAAIFLPLQGVSAIDKKGQSFWDMEADLALFDAIQRHVETQVEVFEMDCHINDPMFAEAMVQKLLELMEQNQRLAGSPA